MNVIIIISSCMFSCDKDCFKYIQSLQKQTTKKINTKILIDPTKNYLLFLHGYPINEHGPFPSCVYIDEKTKKKNLISGFNSINLFFLT